MQYKFDFIQNDLFKSMLERDYQEVENCLASKAYKSVIVMSGSIVEALLVEFLIANVPDGYTSSKIRRLKFHELISLAANVQLISEVTKDLTSVIREYRNYVHPDKEVRSKEFITEDKGIIAYRLLNLIIQDISKAYPILYGTKAIDVFAKLKRDTHFRTVFPQMLDSMNGNEKVKLYNLFVSLYLDTEDHDFRIRNFVYFGFNLLNEVVPNSVHNEYLTQLTEEVKNGSEEKVVKLFDLFGSRIDILNEADKKMLLMYLYSYIGTVSRFSENENLKRADWLDIIPNITNVVINDEEIKKLKTSLMTSIVRNLGDIKEDSDKYTFRDIYNHLIKSLDSETMSFFIEEHKDKKYFPRFESILEDKELMPF